MAEPRELTLALPASWSINQLIRASYHLRNARREMLKAKIGQQMVEQGYSYDKKTKKVGKWTPMRYARADALIGVSKLRDNFELPASLKIEFDALQEVGVLISDAPDALERGIISQRTGKGQFVRIRLLELARAPTQPPLDI